MNGKNQGLVTENSRRKPRAEHIRLVIYVFIQKERDRTVCSPELMVQSREADAQFYAFADGK